MGERRGSSSSERPESGMNKPLADTMRIQNERREGKGDRKEERRKRDDSILSIPQLNGALRDWKTRASTQGPAALRLASTLLSLPPQLVHMLYTSHPFACCSCNRQNNHPLPLPLPSTLRLDSKVPPSPPAVCSLLSDLPPPFFHQS